MWLPVQLSQAAADMHMMQPGHVCQHHADAKASMQQEHQLHQQQDAQQDKPCGMDHHCMGKTHCAKCGLDKFLVNGLQHPMFASNPISYHPHSFFKLYSQPELRPPQL